MSTVALFVHIFVDVLYTLPPLTPKKKKQGKPMDAAGLVPEAVVKGTTTLFGKGGGGGGGGQGGGGHGYQSIPDPA